MTDPINTFTSYNDTEGEGIGKHYSKNRKCWPPSFLFCFALIFEDLNYQPCVTEHTFTSYNDPKREGIGKH